MKTITVELVLDNGRLVRIECPCKFQNALYESLETTLGCGEWWCPERFDGCCAEYMGMFVDRVWMPRVVAML